MTELIAAIAGILGTIIVSIFTYFMARRAGIGPYQDTLVSKLKDLVDLQANEIKDLKEDKVLLEARVKDLEKKVDDLENLTVRQALKINELNETKTNKRRTSSSQQIQSQESDI